MSMRPLRRSGPSTTRHRAIADPNRTHSLPKTATRSGRRARPFAWVAAYEKYWTLRHDRTPRSLLSNFGREEYEAGARRAMHSVAKCEAMIAIQLLLHQYEL